MNDIREDCGAGYYCPAGTPFRIPCDPGYYCPDNDMAALDPGLKC